MGGRGHYHFADADIQGFFDAIDHDVLMEQLERRICDRKVLKRLRQCLQAGVMEAGAVCASRVGSPQGGVISPLLANVYLHVLDAVWQRRGQHLGVLVRYADDFVILCRQRSPANEAMRRMTSLKVEVTGAPARHGSQTVLLAGSIVVDGKTAELRDDQGGRRSNEFGRSPAAAAHRSGLFGFGLLAGR